MSVPFRVDPESAKRSVQQDPFLEFASERPSKVLLGDGEDSQNVADLPVAMPASDRLPGDRRDSAISPTVAFAIGVAGLVTAGVGYYQMGRLLADRSTPAAQTAGAVPVPAGTPAVSATPKVGRLEVVSDPAGARVKVDGAALGVTPLTLPAFKPGQHEIVMTLGASTVTRSVELTAGGTATVTAVMAGPPASVARGAATGEPSTPANAGWVTFESPLELRIIDRGRPRGSTRERLELTAGAYELELVSDIYEIRQSVSATIGAGRNTRVAVPLPSGSLSINALPWADVWIDGAPVGTTPLANLTMKVGSHAVIFRHPTLGERQETVIVKAVTPARLGVNLEPLMFTIFLTLILAAVQISVQTPDRDPAAGLATARQLYASASYEEALDRLSRVNAPDLADQVDTYRALCLLALGRSRESEQVIERALTRNPRYTLDEGEVSPRLMMVFRGVRARLLPAAARNLYAVARASYDAKQFDTAARQFREVLDLLDSGPVTEGGTGDLRVLVEGFLKQSEDAQKAAASAQVSLEGVGNPGDVRTTGVIYSMADRDVIAPVEISRPVPIMDAPPGQKAGTYQGLVEIVIGETGRVEQVAIRKSINPAFDAEVLASTGYWRFQPATKNGKPVKFRRGYEIIGHSR